MNVQHSPDQRLYESRSQNAHEAGEKHQVWFGLEDRLDQLGVKGLATFKTSVRNNRGFSARRARPVKAANIWDIGNYMFDSSSQPVRWCVKKRL